MPGCINVSAQVQLTKQEIFDSWKLSRQNCSRKDSAPLTFDTNVQNRILQLTDSLSSVGIDTVIVYVESLIGYLSGNNCGQFTYPEYAYLLWRNQGQTQVKKIAGKCEFSSTIASESVFSFWFDNEAAIQSEILMPVILSAIKMKDNNVEYSFNITSHQPNYLLFLKTANSDKKIRFDENSITNKEGLFYEENLRSKCVQLWREVTKALNSIKLL